MESSDDDRDLDWRLDSYDVADLLGKWALFYEAQQTGVLSADNRVAWKGDSYLADGLFAAGRWNPDFDLSGGWFDAGDHLKLMFPFNWTVLNIAWGMVDGRGVLKGTMYDNWSNWDWAMNTLLYGADYILRCLLAVDAFVTQVGNVDEDHSKCLRAEADDVTPRGLLIINRDAPGADIFAIGAAALAAAAVAVEAESDPCLCDRQREYMRTAESMYQVASTTMKGTQYADSIPEAGRTYKAQDWQQYMFVAAAWLFRATRSPTYLTEAFVWAKEAEQKRWWADYSWSSSYFGAVCQLLTPMAQQYLEQEQVDLVMEMMDYFVTSHLEVTNGIRRTPKGMTYITEWGSLRHTMGATAVLATYARFLQARDPERAAKILAFAEQQVCYTLGGTGRSFVIGFGNNFPRNPHHRDSALKLKDSGNWDLFNSSSAEYTNPNLLVGALVGGPGADDSYEDLREDYQKNEVALDYNAALFIGVVFTKQAMDEAKAPAVKVTVNAATAKPAEAAAEPAQNTAAAKKQAAATEAVEAAAAKA